MNLWIELTMGVMKKFKLLITSSYYFTVENSELLNVFESEVMYFQENIKIITLLKSIKTANSDFKKLILDFINLYKVYYDLNKEIELKLGNETYIELQEVI